MKNQSCCICNSNHKKLYEKVEQDGKEYYLVRCNKCRLVYLNNIHVDQVEFIEDSEKDLDNKNKEKVEYWSFPNLFEKHKPVFLKFFKERITRSRKFNPNIKTMLDVGCGYGFWMDYCNKLGIETQGIDISGEVVEYAKKELNLNASKEDLMDFNPNKKYDLILMFDVVEHLEDPNKALQKYKEMLTESGLLYIQVPDLIGFRIPWNHGYGLPFHLWQFNFESMKRLLRKNGYKVLGRWNGPIGVIGDYEKGKNIFLKEIMWNLTSKFHISPRLQVIAKKI